jgi:hypothetical protein
MPTESAVEGSLWDVQGNMAFLVFQVEPFNFVLWDSTHADAPIRMPSSGVADSIMSASMHATTMGHSDRQRIQLWTMFGTQGQICAIEC